MEEFQTIPTKELQELVDRLLKKSEAAHEKYNKATEEYNQLMDRYYDCGDIIEEFKKRKGYDSKTNEFPVSMWLDKHRSDPDTTQEEKDAIEDIRIIRRIKLRDADQARAKLHERDLKLTFVSESEDTFTYPIDLDAGTIENSIKKLNEQLAEHAKGNKKLEKYAETDPAKDEETVTFIKQVMQVVLYILAQNAEIAPDEEQVTVTKRGKTIKDKYSEIRKWDVGERIGAAIRQQKMKVSEDDSGNTTHNSPRPHMRRGHWHHFWTGPKNEPENRLLVLRWLSPMVIAADLEIEDAPVVFHKVEQ